jgi:2-polyprenyl-3-methyl-5-hydroxy-6-metoxy-1,4-benzoquinol methylase
MADMNLRANIPVFFKKLIWEIKYGVQNYSLPVAPGDAVSHLAQLPNHARILELGCGGGSLLKALRQTGWQGHYCGVDISEAAIRGASEIEKSANSSWIVSDIESFDSNLRWDVVALIESVYYVKINQVAEVLNRAMGMLNAGGHLLLRIHDLSKHHQYVDAIQGLGSRVEHIGALLVIFPQQKGSTATAAN